MNQKPITIYTGNHEFEIMINSTIVSDIQISEKINGSWIISLENNQLHMTFGNYLCKNPKRRVEIGLFHLFKIIQNHL